MAYVGEVSEEKAPDDLREHYTRLRQEFGFLPHLWQVQGNLPAILRANLELWLLIMQDGSLPRLLKEKIGLVTSAANSNSYCIAAHLEMLRRLGMEKALGRQLVLDYKTADVPEPERALFRFAEKVTREPFSVKEQDITELRQQGWDDAAILEVCLVVGHFNYFNRLAASLGVVPEHVF